MIPGEFEYHAASSVDDAIRLIFGEDGIDMLSINNISFYELIIGRILNIFQVFEVSSIRQRIQVNNFIVRVGIDEKANNVAPNEPCSACYDYGLTHDLIFFSHRHASRMASSIVNSVFQPNTSLALEVSA